MQALPIPIAPTRALNTSLLWSLAMAAYCGMAVWLVVWRKWDRLLPYAEELAGLEVVLTLTIGLLLAFCINRAFDRW